MNKTYTYDEMVQSLNQYVCSIKFVKKDGSIRFMVCTRDKNFIPMKDEYEVKKESIIDKSYIRVFDMTIKEWRTIRVESVLGFYIFE